jgi:hypothetical protein
MLLPAYHNTEEKRELMRGFDSDGKRPRFFLEPSLRRIFHRFSELSLGVLFKFGMIVAFSQDLGFQAAPASSIGRRFIFRHLSPPE